eukprot:gene7814-2260_t
MAKVGRMKGEMRMLQAPPPGISCWSENDSVDELEARIIGSKGCPFAGGVFKLKITIPKRYPFEPPHIKFTTPIYHPNVDSAGRICLDLLKMPPAGSWKPASNIRTVLSSIQLLMSEPNPDDALMADIAAEFKADRKMFNAKAKKWTLQHAEGGLGGGGLNAADNTVGGGSSSGSSAAASGGGGGGNGSVGGHADGNRKPPMGTASVQTATKVQANGNSGNRDALAKLN